MHNNSIKEAIESLVKAADHRDVESVAQLLAPDFRVILNHFPHTESTTILSKEAYLQLMTEGKIGGEDRTVAIEGMFISDTIASAKVILESATGIFHTHYQLICSESKWMFISDMPKVLLK